MGLAIILVAVLAMACIVVGALAGADPEGRGGSWLLALWAAAVLLVVLGVILVFRWLL